MTSADFRYRERTDAELLALAEANRQRTFERLREMGLLDEPEATAVVGENVYAVRDGKLVVPQTYVFTGRYAEDPDVYVEAADADEALRIATELRLPISRGYGPGGGLVPVPIRQ